MEARTSMTARQIGRANPTSQARLQLTLILLAAWNFASFVLLLFNTTLSNIEGVDGVLGARAYGGATGVLVVALFSYAFHWARGDFSFGEMALPVLGAAVLLALLIANMPRQTDSL
jgi:uncharacterized membrane protein